MCIPFYLIFFFRSFAISLIWGLQIALFFHCFNICSLNLDSCYYLDTAVLEKPFSASSGNNKVYSRNFIGLGFLFRRQHGLQVMLVKSLCSCLEIGVLSKGFILWKNSAPIKPKATGLLHCLKADSLIFLYL